MNSFRFAITALIVAFGIISLSAQNFVQPYEISFSSAGAPLIQFDFDVTDSLFIQPDTYHQLFYRDQPATSWNLEPMALLYHTCSTYTISAQISYVPPSGNLEWYLRSENDTAVASQSPQNSADLFPVPEYLMADMGADSVGDAENAAGTWLDITQCYAGYSDTKLYFRMDNNGGGFPTSQGLFTYFLYSIGIIDPDGTDLVAFALVYADVPVLLSPGLYRLDPVDSSFTSIGNISTNISGNSLSLSCNIADLTSQPEWSTWPPPSGFIGMAPLTATQTLSGMQGNDMGKAGVFVPHANLLNYASNTAPMLQLPSISLVPPNTVVGRITYTDLDDHLPLVRNFYLMRGFTSDTTVCPMVACVKDYAAGTLFEHQHTISNSGWYQYYFQFSDGVDTVTTTPDSIYLEVLTYLPGDADGDGMVNIADVVYLINHIFGGGPPPDPLEAGDANCDGMVNIADVVYLINYIFGGGPPPCQ